jgi:hypothetical protein
MGLLSKSSKTLYGMTLGWIIAGPTIWRLSGCMSLDQEQDEARRLDQIIRADPDLMQLLTAACRLELPIGAWVEGVSIKRSGIS